MVNTLLKDVQLYRNGCVITRAGTVHLCPGTQSVKIGGLANGTVADTVRLSVPEKVSGSNVQVKGLTADEKKELTRELEEKIAEVTAGITLKENLKELWGANADFSGRDGISIVDMTEYLEKIPERLEKLDKEIREAKKQLEKLNKELSELQKETKKQFVTADLTVSEEGDYPVQIRFYASTARWYPTYELHTDDKNDEILIRLRACMNQNTGEDWKQAKISLFTGDPSISGTIPTLYPQYVSIYQPPRMMKSSARAFGAATMNAMAAPEMVEYEVEDGCVADEEAMYDVAEEHAMINKGDTMIEYELNGLWDVVKDEDFLCDISSQKVACKYHVVAVPKIDEAAYLAAEVKTSDIEDLLDSEASIYHNGTYMGKVYLNADITKETYDLSLGRDDSIKVKRTQTKKNTSSLLLKSAKKTEYVFEIKVSSSKPKACNVMIIDQVPVSQDKTITIDTRNLSGGELKSEKGEVRWTFDLEPSTTKTLELAYDVTWPKDKQINL